MLILLLSFLQYWKPYKPDEYTLLPLQTAFVSNIGQAKRHYLPKTLSGEGFDHHEMHSCSVITFDENPFYIPATDWNDFIDDNYHFIPEMNINYNYKKICSFTPQSLYVSPIEISHMKVAHVMIKNVQQSGSISLLSVWSISRSVYVPHIGKTVIKPGKEVKLSIFICSPETGVFSTVIFFKTNKGTFPYVVQYNVGNSHRDSAQSSVFYETINETENVTFKMPASGKNVDLVYDGVLFDQEKSSVTGRFVQLVPNNLQVGYYTSFANVIGETTHRTYPFSLFVSNRCIIAANPIVFVPTVTSKKDTMESDIKVVNPTQKLIEITSVSIPPDIPDHVRVSHMQFPIRCEPQSHTTIGRVAIDGTVEGEISTSVKLTCEFSNLDKQETVIPIKGFVKYGRLKPSQQALEMIQTFRRPYEINLTNEFKVPIGVLGARISSQLLVVENFVPFVLKPGETSMNLSICPTGIADPEREPIVLDILTNISTLSIPIRLYSGNVYVSLNKSQHVNKDHVFIEVGGAYCGSSKVVEFYVSNPNPDPFKISNIKTPPSIETTEVFDSNGFINLIGREIKPFSTENIILGISFRYTDKTMTRNDTIIFSSDDAAFSVTINWTPIIGEIRCMATLKSPLIYGKKYTFDITVTNTFNTVLEFTSISSQVDSFIFEDTNETIVIPANETITIKNVTMYVDSELLSRSKTHVPIGKNTKNSRGKWSMIAVVPAEFTFNIYFIFNSSIVFKTLFSNRVCVLQFDDMFMQLNDSSSSESAVSNIQIKNVLDVPLFVSLDLPFDSKYAFSIASEYDAIIEPEETHVFTLSFMNENLGKFIARTKVTTNATPPFYVTVITNIVPTAIEQISSAHCEYNSISLAHSWNVFYEFQNKGTAPIKINGVYTKEQDIILRTNVTYLNPGEAMLVAATFNPNMLLFNTNKFVLTIALRNKVFNFNMTIPLTDKERERIERTKFFIELIMTIVGLAPFVFMVLQRIKEFSIVVGKIMYTKRRIPAEIAKLNSIKKVDVGITATEELIEKVNDHSGGTFVYKAKFNPPQDDCLDYLGEVIADMRKSVNK